MKKFLGLKKRIMVRIYVQYAKNIVAEHPDYFMLLIFATVSFMLISVNDVVHNIPLYSLSNAFGFFVVAVKNTSWIIQILIVGFVIRTIAAGIVFVNKNINTRRSVAKLIRFKY